jgi:hypothetical protein
MSLPISVNSGNVRPIEVIEDDTHFLVRIYPEIRDRAKKISGRSWDGSRQAWVYPKTPFTYDALKEEFERDAQIFNLRRPKVQRPAGIKPSFKELDDEFEEQVLDEIRALEGIGESQGKMHDQLEQIQGILESLKDIATNHSRSLDEVLETQEKATKTLNKFDVPIQKFVEVQKEEVLPDSIDLTRQKEIELFEKALITIVCLIPTQKDSFRDWILKYHPIIYPSDFINEAHEFLRNKIADALAVDPRTDFGKLVQQAKEESIYVSDLPDKTVKPIPILFTLNNIRNRFAHPPLNFSQEDKWSRSILYLMNLALVWSILDVEDSNA